MNDGKDVFTLMREIKLPAELDIGETYGKVSWSVRGIYEGYVGWFDLNPATMYAASPNVPPTPNWSNWPAEPRPWPPDRAK